MALNHQRPAKTKVTTISNIPALPPELQVLSETLADGIQWQIGESAHVTTQETGLIVAAGLDIGTPPITSMIVAATGPGTLQSGFEIATWMNGVATGTSERNAATDLVAAVAVDLLVGGGIGIRTATGIAVPTRTRTELGIGRGLDLAIEITTVADVTAAGREVVSVIEIVNTVLAVADIPGLHHGVPLHVLDVLGLAHVLVIVAEIAHALDLGQPPLGDVRDLAQLHEKGLVLVIDHGKDALHLAPSTLTAMCRLPATGVNHRGVECAPRKEMPGHHGLVRQTAICPPLSPKRVITERSMLHPMSPRMWTIVELVEALVPVARGAEAGDGAVVDEGGAIAGGEAEVDAGVEVDEISMDMQTRQSSH